MFRMKGNLSSCTITIYIFIKQAYAIIYTEQVIFTSVYVYTYIHIQVIKIN